jgi:para-aminobenzoate synthetase
VRVGREGDGGSTDRRGGRLARSGTRSSFEAASTSEEVGGEDAGTHRLLRTSNARRRVDLSASVMLFRSRWMLAMNASRAASMVDTRAIGVQDLMNDGDDHEAHRQSTSTDARACDASSEPARDRDAAVVSGPVVEGVRALLGAPSRAHEMEEEVGSATTRADEASAAASSSDEACAFADANPAAPLRANAGGPAFAFAGADDPSLDDDEWLSRALAAAHTAGLVADPDAVAARLSEVTLRVGSPPRADDVVPAPAASPPSPSVPRLLPGWTAWQGDRTLLVDNYDSYTFNLYHLIAAVDGVPPAVIRNDAIAWRRLRPAVDSRHFARVVLSPGPGTPENPDDVGVCADLLRDAVRTPILGVCLGHQALAAAHGGRVIRAPVPMHGRVHRLRHDDPEGLFAGVPSGAARDAEGRQLTVVRYHSLVVDAKTFPKCLRETAWTDEEGGDGGGAPSNESPENVDADRRGGVIMAASHRERPHHGVQFHPESVCSNFGVDIYRNFVNMAAKHWSTLDEAERGNRIGDGGGESVPGDGDGRRNSPMLVPAGFDPADVAAGLVGDGADVPGSDDVPVPGSDDVPVPVPVHADATTEEGDGPTKLLWMRLPGALARVPGGTETIFWSLHGGGDGASGASRVVVDAPDGVARAATRSEASVDTFWLDSATAATGSRRCPQSRFSFMGGRGGALWRRAVYKLPDPSRDGDVRGDGNGDGDGESVPGDGTIDGGAARRVGFPGGRLEVTRSDGSKTTRERVRLFSWLDARLAARRCARRERVPSWAEAAAARAQLGERSDAETVPPANPDPDPDADASPPFDFWGGFVGYLGYELRAECDSPAPRRASPLPDAAFFLADRVVAFDHDEGDAYVMALVPDAAAELVEYAAGLVGAAAAVAEGVVRLAEEEAEAEARAWMAETERALLAAQTQTQTDDDEGDDDGDGDGFDRGFDGSSRAADPADEEGVHGLAADPADAAAAAATAAARRMRDEDAASDAAGDAASIARRRDPGAAASFTARRNRREYVDDIRASQSAIDRGETYEVCLTNQLTRKGERGRRIVQGENGGGDGDAGTETPGAPDPATLYSVLRRTNPAPYAAYLCFGGCGGGPETGGDRAADAGKHGSPLSDAVAVCCSSPERFLRLSRAEEVREDDADDPGSNPSVDGEPDRSAASFGTLEAKPIKGTAPRRHPLGGEADVAEAANLAASVKDRAENLMIVDLLRNDLGRVCVPGSVRVPGLMKIESYATVHQLVSTIRGARAPTASPAACVRATFPGGSMTGAPKFRTMDIIDGLEPGPRGVYSGSVGFFSVNGAFDLNIVIRTCVVRPGTDEAWIGAGGAITALSDPEGEWDEMALKAAAVLRAVRACDEVAAAKKSR